MGSGDGRKLAREAALDFMGRLAIFEGLDAEDLERLYRLSSSRSLAPGEVLLREGEPGEEMFIVVSGELEVTTSQGGEESLLALRRAGDVVGEMAVLGKEPRSATVRATSPSELLVVGREALRTLLACSDSAAISILGTVAQRLRGTESALMQQEKLASLGTMAAGLAHELNNPAAAGLRSAEQLEEAMAGWEVACMELGSLEWEPASRDRLAALRDETVARLSARAPAVGSERRASEDDLSDWLATEGVDRWWELASTFAEAGWTASELRERTAEFPRATLGTILSWLAGAIDVRLLLRDGRTSLRAISDLVASVRSYAYLDRAHLQDVDVVEGLESTLRMLAHKFKGRIVVNREYEPGLPRIEAYGSELNQVWTNLIDNALDAMGASGELRLHAYLRGDRVLVEVRDDGPGIPPETLPRIFDPFFTTKPVGSGNGLGLHIAYDLIVRRHHGRMHVRSVPGETCFQVALPLRQPRPASETEEPGGRHGAEPDTVAVDSAAEPGTD